METVEIMLGETLHQVRIKCNLVLRKFCLDRDLDVMRYSMIERGILRPTQDEIDRYLDLIKVPE